MLLTWTLTQLRHALKEFRQGENVPAIYNHDDILYFESQVNKFTNQAKAEALMSAVHPGIHTSGIFYWKKY